MPRRRQQRKIRVALLGVIAAVASSTVVAAVTAPVTPNASWTITLPMLSSQAPNFLYPVNSIATDSPANTATFQNLMYRPLYWFGAANSVAINPTLSLAQPPIFSNREVIISLTKGFTWSNAQPVQSNDVVAWLNLMASNPSAFANYAPPLADGTPVSLVDLISNVTVISPYTLVLSLNRNVDPTWFTTNELSQIVPLPQAWDLMAAQSAPHVAAAAASVNFSSPWSSLVGNLPSKTLAHDNGGTLPTSVAGCWSSSWIGNANTGPAANWLDPSTGLGTMVSAANVTQAKKCNFEIATMTSFGFDISDTVNSTTHLTTAATQVGRLFGITNGPWALTSYNASTLAMSFGPSTTYIGQRPIAKALSYVPCASTAACAALVSAGSVDEAVIPSSMLTSVAAGQSPTAITAHQPTALTKAGYSVVAQPAWSTGFISINTASTLGANGHAGSALSQTYLRQALNALSDQRGMVTTAFQGYATLTTGPLPTAPGQTGAASLGLANPYSPTAAKALLLAHGWTLVNGTLTCTKPGLAAAQCGAGIPANTPLIFSLLYPSTSTSSLSEVTLLQRAAASIGVQLHLSAVANPQAVLTAVFPTSTRWDLATWGGQWSFAQHPWPTGENLFATGAISNTGSLSNAALNLSINASMNGTNTLAHYESTVDALAPVIWLPVPVTLIEVKTVIKNFSANPLGTFTPEYWRH